MEGGSVGARGSLPCLETSRASSSLAISHMGSEESWRGLLKLRRVKKTKQSGESAFARRAFAPGERFGAGTTITVCSWATR